MRTQAEFDRDYDFVERVIKNCDNEVKHLDSLFKMVELFKSKWSNTYPYAHMLLFNKIIYNSWLLDRAMSKKRNVIVEKTMFLI